MYSLRNERVYIMKFFQDLRGDLKIRHLTILGLKAKLTDFDSGQRKQNYNNMVWHYLKGCLGGK